ncbi:MAG TPA: hypothetical protein PK605_14900 [Ignavibacteria bacterium]|nr:hypothetical protein [Ignavibacteria bacterium]HRF66755.1 hypothetical protein [Ignavibacteria bacterium]HRJ05689.1 hypothetical protein [Ignavibacteria bacterium]
MKTFIFAASVLFALCLFTTTSSAQVTTYSVTNNSGMVITGVSISPNDANNWGTNLNTTGNVAIDRSFEFTQPLDQTNCVYDVRYQAEDGTYYYVQDVDLCTGTTITLTNPAQDDRGKMK